MQIDEEQEKPSISIKKNSSIGTNNSSSSKGKISPNYKQQKPANFSPANKSPGLNSLKKGSLPGITGKLLIINS